MSQNIFIFLVLLLIIQMWSPSHKVRSRGNYLNISSKETTFSRGWWNHILLNNCLCLGCRCNSESYVSYIFLYCSKVIKNTWTLISYYLLRSQPGNFLFRETNKILPSPHISKLNHILLNIAWAKDEIATEI